jgi:hypothetical protein
LYENPCDLIFEGEGDEGDGEGKVGVGIGPIPVDIPHMEPPPLWLRWFSIVVVVAAPVEVNGM